MKMVKSLLLGSAAGLVAVAGAQAADLPVKAKPVQYVKICSLYGAGFYYIPGTDTCIKLGGFVRTEIDANAGGSFGPFTQINFDNITSNRYTWRSRGLVSVDVRSQTEYGTLRAYADWSVQDDNGNNAGGSPYRPGSQAFANAAFIQFAGFTAGKTISFFDFDGQPYSNQSNMWGSNAGGNGIPVFAYTAQFGNGFSASLALENTISRRTTIMGPTVAATGVSTAGAGYGQQGWPDVTANLHVDQAWGSAQIMGGVHDVNAGYYGAAMGTGSPGATAGYALGFGVKFNLPMLGAGDNVLAQFTWAKGAMSYVIGGSPNGATAADADGSQYIRIQTGSALAGGPAADLKTAVGAVVDATYGAGTGLDLTSGWSVTAGYEHRWNPMWKTSLYGAYGEVDYSATSSARIAANYGGTAAGSGASANWSSYQIGSRTVWTPVANLDLSVEVMYQKVDTAFSGFTGGATLGTFEDKDWVSGIFRVQRNFYP